MMYLLFSLFFQVHNAPSIGMGLLPNRPKGISITGIRYYDTDGISAIYVQVNKGIPIELSYLGVGGYQEFTFGAIGIFGVEDMFLYLSPFIISDRYPGAVDIGGKIDFSVEGRFKNVLAGLNVRNALGYIDGGKLHPEEEVFLLYTERRMIAGIRATYIDGGIDIGWGLQLDVSPAVFRMGLRTDPFIPGVGFGVKVKGMCIDFGFESHPVLGFTESVTIRRL